MDAEALDRQVSDRLFPLAFAQRETLNTYRSAHQRLRSCIVLGVFVPGSRLPPEEQIASLLQVSRGTVREVVKTLQSEELVTSSRGRGGGSFVAASQPAPSVEQVRRLAETLGDRLQDALDLRWVLEPAAADLAARRTSDEDRALLRRLTDHSFSTPRTSYRQADARLHLTIAQMSKVPSLSAGIIEVQSLLHPFISLIPTMDATVQRSYVQHESIVAAIIDGDASTARALMAEHVSGVTRLINEMLATPRFEIPTEREAARA
ncbi:FadR/GntR family transcriptional regulator [Mycobacterium sp. NAZ190054]|uniref:FadR/GntR family transcriptional regulator n=1 Tax=Mycobacterium sp. NAZ190054 TaxID=1747766 RepID=UPI0007984635|nr:FCD domain-containing protein [Mycobacterium sp. NAZ190054]KWX67215.1 hypothetical protein ASJ79_22535 [Mycobacterium sp. NAZ190054]